MAYLYRFLVLVVLSLLGGLLVPFLFHIMVKINLLNAETAPEGFATMLMSNAVYVWMGSVLIGFISTFIKQDWRIALLLCPLILPSVFSIIYTILKA